MSQLIRLRRGRYGRVAILTLDRHLVEHAHADSHIQYWLDGSQSPVWVDGAATPFNRQRAVAINSWQAHASPKYRPGEHTKFLLLYLRGDWFRDECAQLNEPARFPSASFEYTPEIQSAVWNVCRYMLECADSNERAMEALMGTLVRRSVVEVQSGPRTVLESAGSSLIDPRIGRAIQLMSDNLDVRIPLEELASSTGLSRPHFFVLFRRSLKVSPNIYWNTLRMESAIQQLVTSDIPMGELAWQLGFSEPANFSRFFRQHAGVCPSRYRTVAAAHA